MRKRISYEDRKKIEQCIKSGKTKTEIAELIEVNISTVYNELRRGGNPYSADCAQMSIFK